MKIIAKCERCGREFITLPTPDRHGDLVDRYFPRKGSWTEPRDKPCGGLVRMVATSYVR